MNKSIYAVAMTNGFCLMSFEMMASKLLAPYFGHSIHVWGSIIAIFMLSLACGAMFGGLRSKVGNGKLELILTIVLMIISMLYVMIFGDFMLQQISVELISSDFQRLLVASLLFVPFSFFSGMISPYCIGLLACTGDEAGFIAGKLYFVSTIASVIGTLLTSFYFVVLFSTTTILFLNIVLISVSLVIILNSLFRLSPQHMNPEF